jgi:hypothetical protein
VETAVASGLSPREIEAVAGSDPDLFAAYVEAIGEKWTTTEELLAGILELTHANYRVLLSIAGVKRGDIPKPYTVPRPGDERRGTKKKAATSSEFAGWIKARRS